MHRFLVILLTLLIIVDIYLATWTWSEVRNQIGWVKHIPQKTDFKLRHIIQYAPQAFLVGVVLEKYILSLSKRVVLSFIIIVSVGASTELIQYFTPSRIPALMDVFWNSVAAFLGSAFYLFYFKKIKSAQ